jgi:excisionase family DNA binding protein
MKDMLTTNEAASIMNVTPRRVRVLAADGRLKGAALFGRDWLIPRKSAEEWKPLPSHRPAREKK